MGISVSGGGGGSTPTSLAEYDASVSYSVNKYVVYGGDIYKCIQQGTNKTPSTETAYWSKSIIKLDDCGAPDDNTDLDASTSKHGLTKKLPNSATQFLGGTGSWTDLGVSTDLSAYRTLKLVSSASVTTTAINTTISSLTCDTDDVWYIQWHLAAGAAGPSIGVELNADSGTNYNYMHQGTNNAGAGENASQTNLTFMQLGSLGANNACSGYATLFLKSGQVRNSVGFITIGDWRGIYHSGAAWTNTANEVTSIRYFTSQTVTGWMRVYKYLDIGSS